MNLKIAFINPILSKTDFETPLGLLYIAKVCRLAGYSTKVIDLAFSHDLDYLQAHLSSGQFDVVGIYAMSSMAAAFKRAAEIVKSVRPSTQVISGGPHPTLFPEEVLENENIDFTVMGEGEKTVLELLEHIREKATSCEGIQGIGFRREGKIIINERRAFLKNLDELPFPDRDDLDTIEGYACLSGIKTLLGHRTLNLIASRGCSFNCSFCQPALKKIHGDTVRYRSPGNVAEEIDYMRDKWGISGLWFEDDTFTYQKKWVLEFCEKMRSGKKRIAWSCNSRIDTVDKDMLKAMKEAGCVQIRYGLESGNQPVLDNDFSKGITLLKAEEIFRLTHDSGIGTYAYVMLGGRLETRTSIAETEKFLRKIAPDHIQLAMTTPLPGTRLKDEMETDRDVTMIRGRHEDIKLFERCNFDTQNMKAGELEKIYVDMFNKFHFFSLKGLTNKKFFAWIAMNIRFFLFLVKTRRTRKLVFACLLFLSCLKFVLRLVMVHIPFLRRLDQRIFKTRLSFPPL